MRTEAVGKGDKQCMLGKYFVERTMERRVLKKNLKKKQHLEKRYKGGLSCYVFVTAQQESSSPALKEAWERGKKLGMGK